MTDLQEATQYINSIQSLVVDKYNTRVSDAYKSQFAQALLYQTALPIAPRLMVFDQTAALKAFVAWSDGLQAAVDGGAPEPASYNFMLFVTYVQLAPIEPPAAPPAPSDIIGPFNGAMAEVPGMLGVMMPAAYTVAGGIVPIGTKQADARGTFQMIGGSTPMGTSYEWVLLPPAKTA